MMDRTPRPVTRAAAGFPVGSEAPRPAVWIRALRVWLLALLLAVAATPPAEAVSTRDLIELSKAGMSDELLIALIEADGTVFALDAPKILELREQGLSELVIAAMLKNARREPPQAAAPAAPDPVQSLPPHASVGADPYFVIIGEKPPSAFERPAAPVLVIPWWPGVHHPIGRLPRHLAPTIEHRGFGRFINDGWVDHSRTSDRR